MAVEVKEKGSDKMITYNDRFVIESNLLEKFKEIPDKRIFDFIPSAITKEDNKILQSWKNYFKKYKIPFVVTVENNNLKAIDGRYRKRLWKEKYV